MDDLEPRRWRDLRAAGHSRRELDGPTWSRDLRGVRTPACLLPEDPFTRIRAALAACPPGSVLTGWASAFVLGARDLDGVDPVTRALLPVRVHVSRTARIRPRPGLVTDRSRLDAAELRAVGGLLACSPTATAWQLLRCGRLTEAVVALDALLRSGVVGLDAVAADIARRGRRRGVVQARRALELADPGTRSSPETRLRLVWVLAAGLPRPLCNPTVVDEFGHVVGLPDLLDPESGLVGEYDGAGHRTESQHAVDNEREESFEDLGLVVVRAGAPDLRPAGLKRFVARLRAGQARANATPRDRRRWGLRL